MPFLTHSLTSSCLAVSSRLPAKGYPELGIIETSNHNNAIPYANPQSQKSDQSSCSTPLKQSYVYQVANASFIGLLPEPLSPCAPTFLRPLIRGLTIIRHSKPSAISQYRSLPIPIAREMKSSSWGAWCFPARRSSITIITQNETQILPA